VGTAQLDWNGEAEKVFKMLAKAGCIASKLALTDESGVFLPHSDASKFAVGAERQDGVTRVTAFSSRKLESVESKRARMKKLNCLSIQEKESTRLIYREKTILGEAEYHNQVRSRLPVPKLGLFLSIGAGEAHGGHKPPA